MNTKSDIFIGLMDQPHVCNSSSLKAEEKSGVHTVIVQIPVTQHTYSFH